MTAVLICILANALIVIIFHLYEKYQVNNFVAIVVNYITAVITGSLVLGRPAVHQDIIHTPWFGYAVVLGVLFIVLFNILARTVQRHGVTLTSIAQKMSLLAPVLVAMIIYHEASTLFKIIGVIVAILAVIIINLGDLFESGKNVASPILLIITFLGSCLIDAGLYVIDKEGIAPGGDISFVSSIFFFAGVFGIIALAYQILTQQIKPSLKDLIAGILLGIPNFFSIYLIMFALDRGVAGSTLFPTLNVGVLSTAAISGWILFGEKFGKYKILGLTLSILAIYLLSNG